MINNASNHPVLIKKISLQIWTLRSEIEAVIAKRMANLQGEPADSTVDLHNEYSGRQDASNLLQFPAKKEAAAATTQEAQPEVQAAQPEAEAADPNAPADAEAAKPAENPFAEVIGEQPPAPQEAQTAATEQKPEGGQSTTSSEEEVLVLQRRPAIPPEQIFHGKTLLSEIYMDRIHFFCDKSFIEGQNVVIQFMIPECFTINAEVIYSRRYGMKSRIISENMLLYRVAAKFTFARPGERTLLRRFIKAIEPSALEQTKAKAAKEKEKGAKEGGADDVMGDLDNLDL